MSLINDMLHDLEKRRGVEKREVPAYELPIITRVASSGRQGVMWLGGIALVAALTWAAIFVMPQLMGQQREVLGTVAPGVVKVSPAMTPGQLIAPEPAVAEHEESSPPTVLDSEPTALPAAVTEEKLGKPLNTLFPGVQVREADNTVQLTLTFSQAPNYQLVQSGDRDNPLIVEFSNVQPPDEFEVVSPGGVLVKDIDIRRQTDGVQLLIGLTDLTDLERLAITEQADSHAGEVFLFSVHLQRPVESQGVVRIGAQYPLKNMVAAMPTAQQTQQQLAKSDSDNDGGQPPAEKRSTLTKTDNQLSIDRQAYADGMNHFRRGDLPAAATSFRKALSVNPAAIEARLQLINVLQRQGRQDQAREQALSGLQNSPGNGLLRKKYARFLFAERHYDKAIDLLQKQPVPPVISDPEYHALLAALLREAGQFRPASDVYGRLLQLRPDESVWWLGLAISMDQIGESEQARQAYQRALALPGLAPQLQDYIQSRLQVL